MAIKVFSADLNGGDAVTAKNDLIFRIYGATDGYTTPIHTSGSHTSDADVTVTVDSVVIENVDVGSEITFKIASVDEAGNEAPLSNLYNTVPFAYRRYFFNGGLTDDSGTYNATINGTVTAAADRNSVAAQAYLIAAGATNYIDIGSIPSSPDGLTIAFWLQDVPTDIACDYIACVETTGIYIGNKAVSPFTGNITLNAAGMGGVPIIDSGVKSDGNHFIVLTIDPSGNAKLYVDNMLTPKGSANIGASVISGNYRLNSLTSNGGLKFDNLYLYKGVLGVTQREGLKTLD